MAEVRSKGRRLAISARVALAQVKRVGAGGRARIALATNALSSIGNLGLTVAIARSETPKEFGEFAVAFSVYLLVIGLCQATVTDGLLARGLRLQGAREAAQRIMCIGCVSAVIAVASGFAISSAYLIAIGFAIPGLALYDYVKSVGLGVGSPATALKQEVVWTSAALAGVVTAALGYLSVEVLFIVWAGAGSLIGVVNASRLGYPLAPRWTMRSKESWNSVLFGIDHLAGAGASQLTAMALASLVGSIVVGALRGAGTLLGPVTLLTGTVRGLLIPYLARSRHEDSAVRLRSALLVAGALLLISMPLTGGVLFVPSSIGRELIGQTWETARPVLPAIVLETFFGAVSAVAFSGHRVEGASSRTIVIRCVVTPLRIGSVVLAGVFGGAQGAAYAMLGSAIFGAALWWWSYVLILRGTSGSELSKNRLGGTL